jgi:hypothetical protein
MEDANEYETAVVEARGEPRTMRMKMMVGEGEVSVRWQVNG